MPYDDNFFTVEELRKWHRMSPQKKDEIIEKVKNGAKLGARYSSFTDSNDWCAITLDGVIVYRSEGY
jgi:hypothetical protein